ncbi:MAG: PIG-L family deacetylase [Ferruginibacter sp.]|nr:PIG-L family deacetylase [Cytophagales bacterium]
MHFDRLSRHVGSCLLRLALGVGFLPAAAQSSTGALDRVLMLTGDKGGAPDLPQDRGVTGTWQRLQKLRTTASVLYTQAHPDDEQAGFLTYLSRGEGVRTALLSLNRGEGGSNVIGPDLFDGLGLIRTEEFRLAGSYYGLDDLYFTSAVDYGYSKRLAEALEKWGRENVLRDMVRVIRLNRPLVLVSRFHGTERDGHGNHQAAGVLSGEAFAAAGDPNRFPEQIAREGLRPWQPRKLYRGGVRPNEPWHVRVQPGAYSPWLGQSYANFGWLGYSFHRSQFSGVRRVTTGPAPLYYQRLKNRSAAPDEFTDQEKGLFEGLDTSIAGVFRLTGETAPSGAEALLRAIGTQIERATAAFSVQDPSVVVPLLIPALNKTRAAIGLTSQQPDARFLLRVKEAQLLETIRTALGLELRAVGVRAGTVPPSSPYAPLPTMGAVVPGQSFSVEATLVNPSPVGYAVQSLAVEAAEAWPLPATHSVGKTLLDNEKTEAVIPVTVPENVAVTRPYFGRNSLRENGYRIQSEQFRSLAAAVPVLTVVARGTVQGEPVEIRETVRTREANFPYGHESRALKVAPALAVAVQPQTGIIPLDEKQKTLALRVNLLNNADGAIGGEIKLSLPAGWQASPASVPFSFSQPGERNSFPVTVSVPALDTQRYEIRVAAVANGHTYAEGYEVLGGRDLDHTFQYRPAAVVVRGVDVKVAPNLRVGYVMGAGDDIPAALAQLGVRPQLLGTDDLASGPLGQFDVIMVGPRAYAVRQDLLTYNRRLLDYAREGGHLVVLFQTPEFVPNAMAPFPAKLPANAEEISEEDAPVRLLAPTHPVLNRPNRLTPADFDGWVEQRGSKFFSEWDTAYVPIVATQDRGQAPQRGGWLEARCGKGYYTYFAYALHRQLPYAVPGAYRLVANLISLGQDAGSQK